MTMNNKEELDLDKEIFNEPNGLPGDEVDPIEVHDMRWARNVIKYTYLKPGSYPNEAVEEANKIIDDEIDRINSLNEEIKK